MRKIILKFTTLLLIIGLNWTGLSAVGQTLAYFNDGETASVNTYSAGILDFSWTSPTDFSLDVNPSSPTATRSIDIDNDGTLPLEYQITIKNVSGDLCSHLTLEARLGGVVKYDSSITENQVFPLVPPPLPVLNSGQTHNWTFAATLIDGSPGTCSFDFEYNGWQLDSPPGFSDQEIISNTVTASYWAPNTWTQTTQGDFEAGTLSGIDITTSPGDAMLIGAYSVDGNTAALWHLNEGSGTTAYDETSNNNDGTVNGALWTAGKYNSALEFDGTDDYVSVPHSSSLDITNQITLEAWIRIEDIPDASSAIISKGSVHPGSYMIHLDERTSDTYRVCPVFYIGGSYGNWKTGCSNNLNYGELYHVAVTYDGALEKTFINGLLQGQELRGGNIDSTSDPVEIGHDSRFPVGIRHVNGIIDEVRVSNIARTSFPVSYFNSGTLESQNFNGGGMTKWQSLEWDETLPSGNTDITLEVSTSNDGSTWSGWQLSSSNSPIDLTSLPETKYLKWKATLTTSNNNETPVLSEVRVEYYPGAASEHIVLNEFLPNPSGTNPDYGFDFGEDGDSNPRGEWVEIYNKEGGPAVDLSGWYIQDKESNRIYISGLNTHTGSTIIGANGSYNEWLVVYMNQEVLNNGNETIYLYDMDHNLIDSYSYDVSDYCELEPTPGDENASTTFGNCPDEVPGNKSYARIPDGADNWVDPIPTPGTFNILSVEEMGMSAADVFTPDVDDGANAGSGLGAGGGDAGDTDTDDAGTGDAGDTGDADADTDDADTGDTGDGDTGDGDTGDGDTGDTDDDDADTGADTDDDADADTGDDDSGADADAGDTGDAGDADAGADAEDGGDAGDAGDADTDTDAGSEQGSDAPQEQAPELGKFLLTMDVVSNIVGSEVIEGDDGGSGDGDSSGDDSGDTAGEE